MPRKCFWLDTCLVPLALKHLRYQGCVKLLLMFLFLNMPLFRKCNKSVSILLLIVFLLFIHIFLGRKHLNSSFNPCWCFLVPSTSFRRFCWKQPQVSWCKPTAWTINATATWQTKKWAQGITSYGEVVEGPVITLPILPKRPFYRGPIILHFMTSKGHIMQVLSMKLCSWWSFLHSENGALRFSLVGPLISPKTGA